MTLADKLLLNDIKWNDQMNSLKNARNEIAERNIIANINITNKEKDYISKMIDKILDGYIGAI